ALRRRSLLVRLPHEVPSIVAVRAPVRQHRARFQWLFVGKVRDQVTLTATVHARDLLRGLHVETGTGSGSASGTGARVERRMAAPARAATSDPAKIPTLATSPIRGSWKASAVTNRATVKPMPATVPRPTMWAHRVPVGIRPTPSRTASHVNRVIPIGLPNRRPRPTPRDTGWVMRSATSVPANETPALARANSGITANGDQGSILCSSRVRGEADSREISV